MAYPMTQWGQPPPLRQVQRVPDLFEQVGPTILNFLGQYGLQKASQGFQAGQATEKATGEAAAAQVQRDWETGKLKLELGSKERIADLKDARATHLKWQELQAQGLIKRKPGGMKPSQAGPREEGSEIGPKGAEWIFTPLPREYKPEDEAAKLRLIEAGKADKAVAAIVQEHAGWKKDNPKGTWDQFYEQRSPEAKKAGSADVQFLNWYGDNISDDPEQALTALQGLKSSGVDKGWAPETETFVNGLTNQTMIVNNRNKAEVKAAEAKGFFSQSAEDRGYGRRIGASNAEQEIEIGKEGTKARAQVFTLSNLDQLLDRFESGKLGNVILNLQQYADAFGIPIGVSTMPYKEAFKAITNELALRSRNQGEGMVLAGQMSDKDVVFLQNMNPQLITSRGGNRLIIRMRRKMAERQNEAAALIHQYKKEHGGRFDHTGFVEYTRERLGNKSMFGIPEGSIFTGNDDRETGLPVYKTLEGKLIIPEV